MTKESFYHIHVSPSGRQSALVEVMWFISPSSGRQSALVEVMWFISPSSGRQSALVDVMWFISPSSGRQSEKTLSPCTCSSCNA